MFIDYVLFYWYCLAPTWSPCRDHLIRVVLVVNYAIMQFPIKHVTNRNWACINIHLPTKRDTTLTLSRDSHTLPTYLAVETSISVVLFHPTFE